MQTAHGEPGCMAADASRPGRLPIHGCKSDPAGTLIFLRRRKRRSGQTPGYGDCRAPRHNCCHERPLQYCGACRTRRGPSWPAHYLTQFPFLSNLAIRELMYPSLIKMLTCWSQVTSADWRNSPSIAGRSESCNTGDWCGLEYQARASSSKEHSHDKSSRADGPG